VAQQGDFPLGGELFLDARPVPGSKRIPNIDIAEDHSFVLEMWCNRVEGQLVIAGDTITVVAGPPTERPCTSPLAQRDADLIAALNAVTNWRRAGEDLLLVGPSTLRFKGATH
jgi:heat shock protein HslJ